MTSPSSTKASDDRTAIILNRIAKSRNLAPVLLFLLCCGFCWKLVLSNQYTWIDNSDAVNMDAPRLQFQQTTLRNHELPLWDPHLWCGQPFLGQFVGAAYPLNWILFFLKPNGKNHISIAQLNWYFVTLHFLGALFAYWLCRSLDLSRFASVFGGFVFSFSGFFALTLWPEVLGGLLLTPLVFLFLLRAHRRRAPYSSAALCGMFLGMAWLSGHHEIPTYLCMAVAAICMYDIFTQRGDRRRSFWLFATIVLFTVLASGLQTFPGYEYARLAIRWVGADHPVELNETIPYRIHTGYSFNPSSFVSVVLGWGGGHDASIFTGITVLSLALLALFTQWRNPSVRLIASLAFGGFFLALGGSNVIHGFLYAVNPLFQKTRNPERLVSMFSFGVAILSAFGLDALPDLDLPLIRNAGYTLLGLFGFITALALASPAFKLPGPDDSTSMFGLIALLLAAVLFAARSRALSNRSAMVAVAVLAIVELGNVSTRIYTERRPDHETLLKKLTDFDDIVAFLRRDPAPLRVNATEATGAFNLGDWEGIDTLSGFGAGVTKNLVQLDWPSVRTQNLLAVDYAISKQPPRSDQQIVFQGSSGFRVLKNSGALPRARIVHQVENVASIKEFAARVDDASFNSRNTVLLIGSDPKLQFCGGEELANVSKRTANSVLIDAKVACRGMLILADTWYPGWIAEVDSHRVPVYQAYHALRGVVLEPGSHRIAFRYRPASVWIGALLSTTGILAACGLAVWDRRRLRR